MTECFSLWTLQGMTHTRPSVQSTSHDSDLIFSNWACSSLIVCIIVMSQSYCSPTSRWLKQSEQWLYGDQALKKNSKSTVIKMSALLQVLVLLSNKRQVQDHSHQCLHCLVEKLNKFSRPLEKEQSYGLFHVPNNGQFSPLSFLW